MIVLIVYFDGFRLVSVRYSPYAGILGINVYSLADCLHGLWAHVMQVVFTSGRGLTGISRNLNSSTQGPRADTGSIRGKFSCRLSFEFFWTLFFT